MELFETLAIKHGQILNLEYHQIRYNHALNYLKTLGVAINDELWNLKNIIKNIPINNHLIRCRVDYDGMNASVQFFDYTPKIIQSFCVVNSDINYCHKYANRDKLTHLLKQNADEVIIIKNDKVTDCTIGNLLFFKNGIWYTSDTPLLSGTQRAYLLDIRQIHLTAIYKNDIFNYEKIMMINALNPFDENRAIMINAQTIK